MGQGSRKKELRRRRHRRGKRLKQRLKQQVPNAPKGKKPEEPPATVEQD